MVNLKKILIIGMSNDCGGIENYILNLCEHLDSNKYKMDFLVKEELKGEFKKRILNLKGDIVETGIFKNNIIGVYKKISEIYRNGHYDLVYINLSYAPTMIYALPAMKYDIPIYIHSHASDDIRKLKHLIFRKLFFGMFSYHNYRFLGCSEDSCKWMFGNKKMNQKGYCIINNAVDYERYKYAEEKRNKIRNLFCLEQKFVVGHVGRFSPEKNHVFILQTFKQFLLSKNNAILMLVGTGELESEIKKEAKDMGIYNKIVFVGRVSDTSEYYSAMDCFWLPSLYEGFPIVAIEAQTSGLKCLISDNIDKSVDILGDNKFLSIKDQNAWIAETINICNKENYNRNINPGLLYEKEYELSAQAKKIERIFG